MEVTDPTGFLETCFESKLFLVSWTRPNPSLERLKLSFSKAEFEVPREEALEEEPWELRESLAGFTGEEDLPLGHARVAALEAEEDEFAESDALEALLDRSVLIMLRFSTVAVGVAAPVAVGGADDPAEGR